MFILSRISFLSLAVILLFSFVNINGQTCGGTFGNPIFNETFGTVNTANQTLSPPLVAPASTNYIYTSAYPPNDGFYTISNQSQHIPWGFITSADHTIDAPGTFGNMLVVNASFSSGEFYRRRVSNLCSNQIYRFSTWILNIVKTGSNLIKPNVTLQVRSISGAIIGSVSTGNIAEDETWKEFSIDFLSDPTSTQVDVVLINNSPGGNGNDLAIDDITFRPCGPTTNISANIPNILSGGTCDNSQSFQLNANINTNTFLNVNFIWQKSTDGGITWVNVMGPSTNPTLNIAAGSYQNNDQYRFIVGEAANISSQNCQVISSAISVIVNGYPNAPVVNSTVNYCHHATATPLNATGTNLLWYNSATGGTGSSTAPTPNTSAVGSVSYWVSQTANNCESPRSQIQVNVNAIPAAPTVNSTINYCQNTTATALTATGTNLLWYTSATGGTGSSVAPTPSTITAGNTSFWVSQTVNGCESSRSQIQVNINAIPAAPTVNSPINYCQNTTATALTATGSNLLWYTSATGGTGSSVAPTPSTITTGNTSFWVSQTVNGCESLRYQIQVNVNAIPSAPIVNSIINYCQSATATALTATGTNLLWYTSATGGTGSSTAPNPNTSTVGNTSFWVSQTVNGCESLRSQIQVTVNAIPAAPSVNSPISFCQNTTATTLTATGTNLLWYTSATGGIGSSVAPTPNTSTVSVFSFWVSQTVNACESARAEIKVNIVPAPFSNTLLDVSICNGDTVTLDAGSGFSSYEWNTVPPTFSQTLQVTALGTYSVKLTGSNACIATQSVNVTAGISPTITNITTTNNSLTITAVGGNPPYLYSIDNQQNWQTSNVFTNLIPGVYTVFVKSQSNSCSISQETAILFVPNTITPNDDGINDVFTIQNLRYFPNATISIYDRYGKVVFASKDISNFNWNGKHLGSPLNTDTYWYVLDFGENSRRNGWILLKNRD